MESRQGEPPTLHRAQRRKIGGCLDGGKTDDIVKSSQKGNLIIKTKRTDTFTHYIQRGVAGISRLNGVSKNAKAFAAGEKRFPTSSITSLNEYAVQPDCYLHPLKSKQASLNLP
ncbi:MAG: hypothetical protein COB26_09510 [Piscirickettsiaceae bacterium]|nr:MAG: hypothetical protein COB26_09510 [Piscirickettsiaceae bacterium]